MFPMLLRSIWLAACLSCWFFAAIVLGWNPSIDDVAVILTGLIGAIAILLGLLFLMLSLIDITKD